MNSSKTKTVFLVTLTVFASTVESVQECIGWAHPLALYDGNCYKVFKKTAVEWEEAEDFCKSVGGHLVSIHSKEENQILLGLNYEIPSLWIGIKRAQGEKEGSWSDGTEFDFDNLPEYSTDDEYGYYHENGKWYYFESDDIKIDAFACKKAAHVLKDFSGYLHSRSECKGDDDQGGIILSVKENDVIDCQNLCNSDQFRDECKSFYYTTMSKECTLRDTPVANISACEMIGGHDEPTLEDIEKVQCLDFYLTECDLDEKVMEGISSPEDCQYICYDNYHGCSHWTFNNNNSTTCTLYFYGPICQSVVGPATPSVETCFS